jgi:uncharacterized cupin superfamily protein
MKAWRCSVCGFIYRGDGPPELCPNCGAPGDKFVPVAEDFEELHIHHGQKLSFGPEVEINQFFGDYQSLAPFIYNLPVGKQVNLHRHPTSDELFFILKGKLRFRVGGREFVAAAGEVIKGRMNVPHAFENIGDEPAAFLSVKGPKPVSTEFVK